MSFLVPKQPKVVSTPAAAAPATQADATDTGPAPSQTIGPNSLISTSSQGLTRKARTQKPSLIGASRAS